MLLAPLQQAVIRVVARVRAGQALEAGILREAQRETVLGAQLLQLSHHAVSDTGYALGEQAVHHGLVYFELVLDTEVDKVGIHEDVVRRAELCVVLKEHRSGHLGHLVLSDLLGLVLLGDSLRLLSLVLGTVWKQNECDDQMGLRPTYIETGNLHSGVLGRNHLLCNRKLSGLFLLSHYKFGLDE